MNKADTDAIKWAIKKFWRTKTDEQLATGLNTTTEQVTQMREEMGLKGNESLKDFARRYLLEMTEPQKREFMSSLSPELIFKMAEGNPATTGSLEISQEPIRIDITHQLLKVYGPTDGTVTARVLEDGEGSRIAAGSGK